MAYAVVIAVIVAVSYALGVDFTASVSYDIAVAVYFDVVIFYGVWITVASIPTFDVDIATVAIAVDVAWIAFLVT